MPIRTGPWPTGVPCWAHLSANDPTALVPFYEATLGWSVRPEAADPGGGHLVAQVQGRPAAGLGTDAGGPPGWTLCVATSDLEGTLATAVAAGGRVLTGPDPAGRGRVAVVADPTGAAVSFLEGAGAGWVNGPGGISWEDLRSSDPAASVAFYAAVLGWRFEPLFEGYGTVANPDAPHPVGGIGPLWGAEPGWLVYFGVVDVDAAVRAALATGGSLVAAPENSPYGRMARVADPQGSTFALFTPPADAPQPTR